MSSSFIGRRLRLSVFGQSHSGAIGMTLDGLPAGISVDINELRNFLARRAPGSNDWSTPRKEADLPEFLCGIRDGYTCGAPVTAVIRNTNTNSSDYEQFSILPRPGHADYTAEIKFRGYQDYAGGGHFSGRLTAPLCIAGGILLQELKRHNIEIDARILSVGSIRDDTPFTQSVAEKLFPVSDDRAGEAMRKVIAEAKADGDSVGGIVECIIRNLPAGVGEPMFDGLENQISRIIFAIPAVKGLEFGSGFNAANMNGSRHNDAFYVSDSKIGTKTNHAGGILGGISNGMPVVFRVAFKPTPSIAKPQQSVNLRTLQEQILRITGRHDPCIVPRAVPVVEAAAAIAIYDLLEEQTWN